MGSHSLSSEDARPGRLCPMGDFRGVRGGSSCSRCVPCYYSVVSFARMHAEITEKLSIRAAFLLLTLAHSLTGQTPTGISLTITSNPVLLGQGVTLSASINPSQASGEVTFYDDSIIVGIAPAVNGSASLSTVLLNPGRRSLKARFQSHSGFGPSVSQSISVSVNAAPSAALTKLVSYPTTSTINQQIAAADFNGDGHWILSRTITSS